MNKYLLAFVLLFAATPAFAAKSGDSFNPASDVNWADIDFKFLGICICPRPPPKFYETGEIYQYWDPSLFIDTASISNYSAFTGSGGDENTGSITDVLGGKNKSSDAVSIADESTFMQAHAFIFSLMDEMDLCKNEDTGAWWTEYDSMWQDDMLAVTITPEVSLFANKAMQMLCMTDAAAVSVGFPLNAMPWCIGSSGSTYPVTGHVDNDNIVQASNTVASRLIFKLNRLFMLCDPAILCGCEYTPVWKKANYKMHTARPDLRATYPIGKAAKVYDSGLNPAYQGAKGPNDEFLWVVFRKVLCCTCCE